MRADRWSEGAAQVATEQGLQAPSFEQAAKAYTRSVGRKISKDTVRRITEGFGQGVGEWRQEKVEEVYDPLEGDEDKVEQVYPIQAQGNISTDGTMILVRGEGWKEVKLTVISAVELDESDTERGVTLSRHSCQMGLWDADTMARYQYLEGLRRGLWDCEKLSSVNDAAAWILRITQDNFPQATLIVDWPHAQQHLWQAAYDLYGEGTESARQWAEAHTDLLWQGQGAEILSALEPLTEDEDARRAHDYLANHLQYMDYARYRRDGYPIGSGTVESGGKNYVQHRLKRSGRGWNRDTGQAMLSALSEFHSDRFELAWEQCA